MAIKAILYLIIAIVAWSLTFWKPYIGILYFVFTYFLRPTTIAYNQLNAIRIPLVTALVTLAAWGFGSKNERSNKSSTITFMFLYFLITLISTLFAVNLSESWKYNITFFKMLLFCFLTFKLIDTRRKLNHFVLMMLVGTAFLAVWGFDQHFRGNDRLEGIGGVRSNSSNDHAGRMVLFLPYCIYYFVYSKNKLKKLIAIIGSALFTVNIIFTQSRGGLLGCIVVYSNILFRTPGLRKKATVWILIPIMAFIIFSNFSSESYINRMKTIFHHDGSADGDIEGRRSFWKSAFEIFKDYSLTGVGQENFKFLVSSYTDNFSQHIGMTGNKQRDTHNTYLKVLAEGGIFAFVFYSLMILSALCNFVSARKISKSTDDKELLQYSLAGEAGLMGLIICAVFTSYNYFEPFFWVMTLSNVIKNISNSPSESSYDSNVTIDSDENTSSVAFRIWYFFNKRKFNRGEYTRKRIENLLHTPLRLRRRI